MRYAELQVTTHFSFLRGASSARELFERATELGIDAIGIVDRNSLAGVVRALEAARGTGCAWSSVVGSISPMACPCWSTRWIAPPIPG